MSKNSGIRIALVGLGFGAEFAPIYQRHPWVSEVALCDPDRSRLDAVGDACGIAQRFSSLDEVLSSGRLDAVHLVTPIPLHAAQTVAVLDAGLHCACTVPMATSLADIQAIIAAERRNGKRYMMMETAVYTREFLYVQQLRDAGELGAIQFLRGAHYQDMEGWPAYWRGLPPRHYATHAVAPLLALAASRVTAVHCFGSGHMRPELAAHYGNPYPIETAIMQLARERLAAEVTRSLFHTARAYSESFNVYGEAATFEWQQVEAEEPLLFRMALLEPGRGRPVTVERISVPDRADLLPEALRRFTRRGVYDEAQAHLSFLQGGGHGGSHPHLVHEFVSSIVRDRPARIDATTAATWTAPGICAHISALRGGELVAVPDFAPLVSAA